MMHRPSETSSAKPIDRLMLNGKLLVVCSTCTDQQSVLGPLSQHCGNVGSWTESEGTSSSEQCEHNVESLALNVMEPDQSGEKISLFLEDWELASVALSCHIALDMLCQEMREAR